MILKIMYNVKYLVSLFYIVYNTVIDFNWNRIQNTLIKIIYAKDILINYVCMFVSNVLIYGCGT